MKQREDEAKRMSMHAFVSTVQGGDFGPCAVCGSPGKNWQHERTPENPVSVRKTDGTVESVTMEWDGLLVGQIMSVAQYQARCRPQGESLVLGPADVVSAAELVFQALGLIRERRAFNKVVGDE